MATREVERTVRLQRQKPLPTVSSTAAAIEFELRQGLGFEVRDAVRGLDAHSTGVCVPYRTLIPSGPRPFTAPSVASFVIDVCFHLAAGHALLQHGDYIVSLNGTSVRCLPVMLTVPTQLGR